MVNAQEWLDRVHPKEKRKNITELDIRDNDLEGKLKLEGFDKLKKFCCRGNKLVELIVGDYSDLEDLDCSFNNLSNLNLSKLKKLQRFSGSDNLLTDLNFFFSLDADRLISLNIVNNNFPKQDLSIFSHFVNLKLLWIGNDDEEKIQQDVYNKFHGSLKTLKTLTKLESLNVSNTDIDSGLEYLSNGMKYIYCLSEQRPESKVKKITGLVDEGEGKYNFKNLTKVISIRNILLIGRTGSGKSTLANVLIDNGNFEEVFKESAKSVGETKEIQIEEFEWEGAKYRVIDTVGVANTSLSRKIMLIRLLNKIYYLLKEEGISQIFFLVKDGNLTEEEKEIFKLLETILGSDITKYTTIVRTNFANFEDKSSCIEDSEEIKKMSDLFASCEVIHVDNPSINTKGGNNFNNRKTRESSREILLNYLESNCQENCKPNEILLNQLRDIENKVFEETQVQVEVKTPLSRCPIL